MTVTLRDVQRFADEQGFTYRRSSGGHWIFADPLNRSNNPNYRTVTVSEPQKHTEGLRPSAFADLARMGMKIAFVAPRRPNQAISPQPKESTMAAPPSLPNTPRPQSISELCKAANVRISETIGKLSELESLLGRIESESAANEKLRALFKELNRTL